MAFVAASLQDGHMMVPLLRFMPLCSPFTPWASLRDQQNIVEMMGCNLRAPALKDIAASP